MTEPIDFAKRKKANESKNRVNKELALESIEALRLAIEMVPDDEEIDLFVCSFLTNQDRSIETIGINVGDELRALGLVSRWNHLINYLYDEE